MNKLVAGERLSCGDVITITAEGVCNKLTAGEIDSVVVVRFTVLNNALTGDEVKVYGDIESLELPVSPTGHHILILPDPIEDVTKGGIVRPSDPKEREQYAVIRGTLVAVGPQAWKGFGDGVPWAKVGDKVIFSQYGGSKVVDEHKIKWTILNDEDVVAVEIQGGPKIRPVN